MRYFHSICHFFKKCRNWRLAQMTPLFTFVEPPAPFREDPSTLKVNFSKYFANFSRNCFFLTFFKTPISKVNCLVKLSVFSQCIIFEKVSKLKTLRGGRGFKCPGRLEKRKKSAISRESCKFDSKVHFWGLKGPNWRGPDARKPWKLASFDKPSNFRTLWKIL